jgi:hypothetical protein
VMFSTEPVRGHSCREPLVRPGAVERPGAPIPWARSNASRLFRPD